MIKWEASQVAERGLCKNETSRRKKRKDSSTKTVDWHFDSEIWREEKDSQRNVCRHLQRQTTDFEILHGWIKRVGWLHFLEKRKNEGEEQLEQGRAKSIQSFLKFWLKAKDWMKDEMKKRNYSVGMS